MALRDYAALDEDDFYGQGFEKSGVVSLWAGLADRSADLNGLDILQDLCGVGYYSLDDQEVNCDDFKLVPFAKSISELSYFESFSTAAIKAATQAGVSKVRWVIAQYDFEYDPTRVKRQAHDDPKFLGSFAYINTD